MHSGHSPSKRIKEIRLAVAGAITLANTNLRDKTTYKFSIEKNAQSILETKQFDSNWIRKICESIRHVVGFKLI